MKTSNKIFLSFLIFLFSGIIALYLGSKYYLSDYDTTKFISQEKSLPPFSVIVSETNTSITIENSLKRKLKQICFKESKPKFASFEVRNDTLFVKAAMIDPNKLPATSFAVVISCDNVNHFIAKDRSQVNFTNYQVDSLFVKMDNTDLIYKDNNSKYIKMIARNSRANFTCTKLKSMILKLENTELDVTSKMGGNNIFGTIKKNSNVQLFLAGNIKVEVDQSSRLNIFNSKN